MRLGLSHILFFKSFNKGTTNVKLLNKSTGLYFKTSLAAASVKENSDLYLPDGQLRYSTNRKWHAAMNFLQKPRDIPQYQYPVILLSMFVCLIYFCFLREENELDDILAGKVSIIDKIDQTKAS